MIVEERGFLKVPGGNIQPNPNNHIFLMKNAFNNNYEPFRSVKQLSERTSFLTLVLRINVGVSPRIMGSILIIISVEE